MSHSLIPDGYEFARFERHFEPSVSLVRFLLRIGALWLVAWWWYLCENDIPDAVLRKINKPVLVACLTLLLASCSLSAQTSNSQPANSQPQQAPQQCWFTDPTDADNLILAPCDTGVAADKPSASNPQPDNHQLVTPKPAQPDVHPNGVQPSAQTQVGSHDVGPLTASGWCVIQSRNSKQASTTGNSIGSTNDIHAAPGCDVGLGLSLFTRNRLSLVSVLGTKTLGIGLALIVVKPTPTFPRVVALALGIVVQYDSSGIYRQVYPALGATMSFRGSTQQ